MPFLVVHADASPETDFSERPEARALAGLPARLVGGAAADQDGLIANLRDADVVLSVYAPLTRRVLAALPRCRGVVRYGVGLDNVDVAAATDLGIVVAHVPDFCTEEVSNHALLMVLACAKRLVEQDRHVRSGGWHLPVIPNLAPVHGQTLGIVGVGNIGRTIARKAQALAMSVVGHDPYVDPAAAAELGVQLLPLDDLLRQADYVVLQTPLTPETRHLISARELALMKPTAYLINTARGPVVDQEALVEALSRGTIAGAGLDVFEREPLPRESPLRGMENVVLTPHTASSSWSAFQLLREEVGAAAAALLRGRWPRCVANRGVQPRVPLAPPE